MTNRLRLAPAILIAPLALALGCAPPIHDSASPDVPGRADWGGEPDGPPASGVELKVTIDPSAIDAALAALSLGEADAELRYVTFYDTRDLVLFQSGIILRSRKIIDDDDDSTVKIRPLTADEAWWLDPALFDENDFKCELDATPDRAVSSCSLTTTQDSGEIDDVAFGERDVDKLFSEEQEDFLWPFSPWDFEIDHTIPLGPVETRRWKIELAELPEELTVELWEMPDGSDVLELSIKVDEPAAEASMTALLELVTSLGLPLDPSQSTKTERVLSFFAGT